MEWTVKQQVRGTQKVKVHYLSSGDTLLASVWPVAFAGGFDVFNVRDTCSIGFAKTLSAAKAKAEEHMQDAVAVNG